VEVLAVFKKQLPKQILAVAYLLVIVLLYVGLDRQTVRLDINEPASETATFSEQYAAVEPVMQEKQQENQYDIMIDLTQSMLYLFENDKLIKKYPVAQGKSESPSPIGTWYIVNKARNWGTGFGTRWMGLNVSWGTYGIHGTNKPGSIGQRASHGCFRMQNRDVEELYSIVPFKTRVLVYGGPYGNMGSNFDLLAPGDRKSQVAEVQKRLQKLGYYAGSIDGHYGEGTKAALIKFKKDNHLPITHYVDMETYKALGILAFE
jgi:hypothetical protein